MTQPVLRFVHGNSFPSGTYRRLLEHLRSHYDVRSLPMHAHNPRYPVDNGWHALTRELIDELIRDGGHPVVLVGHSMGGMLSLMAASIRPDLVRCVVLLDAPVVAGWRAGLWRIAKMLGRTDNISPARFSKGRREFWPDADAAYRHFAVKPVFAAWAPDVLRDYIEHGFVPHAHGVTLRFARNIETRIYRTLPHHIGRLMRRRFPVPIGFIGGIDSFESRQAGLAATKRLVGPHFRQLPGGHLFPMETPALAAGAVHEMIRSLLLY